MKFIPKDAINNIPALVQIAPCHWTGNKPLSEPILIIVLKRICFTRPQWVTQFTRNDDLIMVLSLNIGVKPPVNPALVSLPEICASPNTICVDVFGYLLSGLQWSRTQNGYLAVRAHAFPWFRASLCYSGKDLKIWDIHWHFPSSNGNISRVTGPLCAGIHRSPVNSPHKGQRRGALMFSLFCAWTNSWVNNRDAGDLKRHRPHYDVPLMSWKRPFPKSRYWS